MTAPFRARLRGGEVLHGTILSLAAPEAADLLAGAGFDWLFVDAEHGVMEPRDVLLLLQAVAGRCAALVRVPALDEAWIKRALDAGADGIIVPQVSTAAEAERVVRFAHYPPRGTRGFGTARANRYGMSLAGQLDRAAATVTVVVQAETAGAVEQIESIAAVPGIDAVFVGPFDLSTSLGYPGEVDHPAVRVAIGRVASACTAAGVRIGIFAARAEGLRGRVAEGFTLLAAGVDTLLLGAAAEGLLLEARRLAGSPARGPGTR
jgi:2-dehydro-3-deoxyglucarate aldolase/4-hydroxy-2-oxoheptanedioate aldolase